MDNIQEEFISTVSHEMRTPLTSIRGFSQTLLASWDKIDDNNKKKFIKIIEEQSNRLINLVENILSVSKINSEKYVYTKVNVNSVIENLLPLFTEQYKTKIYKLNLSKNIPYCRLDNDKFQQILTNLFDNAGKYSQDGKEILVSTEIVDNNVIIKVKDNGVGIKKEDFPKIFQKFSRLENYLTGKTQGNGLGLYITKQLVDNMNGSLTFESEEGLGTTFFVKFPLYNTEEVLKCVQK